MTADESRRLPSDIGEPDGVLIVDKHAGTRERLTRWQQAFWWF